jgi:hypothetical protein
MVDINPALAEEASSQLRSLFEGDGAMAKVRAYLKGDQALPYMPNTPSYRIASEYSDIAKRAVSNWLPLVSDTFVKRLFVEGYRATDAFDNSKPWEYWQANGLDARQTIVHRSAIEYGVSYVLVLPGSLGDSPDAAMPYIKPIAPGRAMAWYNEPDDEWAEYAIEYVGKDLKGAEIVRLYDDQNVYTFTKDAGTIESANDGAGAPRLIKPEYELTNTVKHGLGKVPLVRFRERLEDRPYGAIYPLLPDQDKINEITFSIHMAFQFGVFRQRWATGMAIPLDENGKQLPPFQAGIDRLWVSEDTETKFGEFQQTDVSNHLIAYRDAVKTFAAHAAIDPNMLTGDVVNVSAASLGSLKDSTTQQVEQYKMIFGESWEQVFRLAAVADPTAPSRDAEDLMSQTRWRDDTSSEFLNTVQGLAMLSEKLGVPGEALWEKVPGMSDQDIAHWHEVADKQADTDPIATLAAQLNKQGATPDVTQGEDPTSGEPSTPEPVTG